MVSMSSSSMLLAEIFSWVAAAESSRSHNELKSGKKCNYIVKNLLALAFSSGFFFCLPWFILFFDQEGLHDVIGVDFRGGSSRGRHL